MPDQVAVTASPEAVSPIEVVDLLRESQRRSDEKFGSVAVLVTATTQLEASAALVDATLGWRATPLPFAGLRESAFRRQGPRCTIEAMTVQTTTRLAG